MRVFMDWMEDNSNYDVLSEKGSLSLLMGSSKPFCMLACSLYRIVLEEVDSGQGSENSKLKYILQNFKDDYERYKEKGYLDDIKDLKLLEDYFGLYGNRVECNEEELVRISKASSDLKRSLKYVKDLNGNYGLVWDMVRDGRYSDEVVPFNYVPGISDSTRQLLSCLLIDNLDQLSQVFDAGFNETISELQRLLNDETVLKELRDLLDKKYLK